MPIISPKDVTINPDGRYTTPHTWGVYELPNTAELRYRKGNHPIRQKELEKQFGKNNVKLKVLFTSDKEAIEKKEYYNSKI